MSLEIFKTKVMAEIKIFSCSKLFGGKGIVSR